MAALVFFVRGEMTGRLTAQYERRVATLVEVIEDDLGQERQRIGAALDALREDVLSDNRFRRAAVDRAENDRRYLLDYAGNAMRLSGLSMLQIQDETGRIVSSGHFRNEYDRIDPVLPSLLGAAPDGTALIRVRAPDAPFLALASIGSLVMGDQQFAIIAGVKIDQRFLAGLARDADLTVDLVYEGGVLQSSGESDPATIQEKRESGSARSDSLIDRTVASALVRDVKIAFIDPSQKDAREAAFRVSHDLAELNSLRRSIDRWFLIAVVLTAIPRRHSRGLDRGENQPPDR